MKRFANGLMALGVITFALAILISGIISLGLALQGEKPHKPVPLIPKAPMAYS